MAHPLPGRCRDPGNISHHRFGHMIADEGSCGLFVRTTDFTHHDDAFGLRVLFEQRQHIDEVHTANRIAADTNAGTLAESELRGLMHCFISERART